MAKLTDTQLIVLSKAVQREDGTAALPKGLAKAPAAKVAASLINRKLMREVRAKDGMPVWRRDDDGREYSLVILRAGRDAIGVDYVEVGKDAAVEAVSSKGTSRRIKGQIEARQCPDLGASFRRERVAEKQIEAGTGNRDAVAQWWRDDR